MTGRVLLYGATGYSGGLIAARLAGRGVDLVLAGRNAAALAALAERLGVEWRAFGLGDEAALDHALVDIALVVHAAGPFVRTARPMIAACLRKRVDYLDITGEWPVFDAAMALSVAAVDAGIMLMPGAGVCVVATDCLLAMAAEIPGTVALRLAASRHTRLLRGSIRTIMGLNDAHVRVRRAGQVVCLPAGERVSHFDFGAGPAAAVAVTWPEIITGEFSKGIRNIETYAEAGRASQLVVRAGAALAPIVASGFGRGWPEALAELWPATGTETAEELALETGFVLVAEAIDRWRRVTPLRLRIDDGHLVTAIATDAIVERVLAGQRRPGFETPARLFGSDFILKLGCAEIVEERS